MRIFSHELQNNFLLMGDIEHDIDWAAKANLLNFIFFKCRWGRSKE